MSNVENFVQEFSKLPVPFDAVSDRHIVLAGENTGAQARDAVAALGHAPKDLAEIARDVAVDAARLVSLRHREVAPHGGAVPAAGTKSSKVDPVTVVDRESEDLIRRELDRRLPGSRVLGEEDGVDGDREHSVLWVVNPIDGTVNFMYGLPAYSVSIAATIAGVPVAGAVADVAAGKVYCAAMGDVVRVFSFSDNDFTALNDWSGIVDTSGTLGQSLVATGFSYTAERRKQQAELLVELLPQVRDIRRMGSAALDLVHCGSGEVDAYYEHGLGPWDHAAGCIIAARSHCVVNMPKLDVTSADGVLISAARRGVSDSFVNAVLAAGSGTVLHPM